MILQNMVCQVDKLIRKTASFLLLLLITAMMFAELGPHYAESAESDKKQPEYHVKLVFIFNFMKFCTWPENKRYGDWIIGVVGDDPFEDEESWRILKGRTLNGRPITHIRFKDFKDSIDDIRKCHVIYSRSLKKNELIELKKKLNGSGSLIVTDNKDLEDVGSMINFVNTSSRGQQKISFEVNLDTMNAENFRMKLSVLKLARKVVGGKVEPK